MNLRWCFYPLLAGELPAALHSRAGLARKIGMDEALHRFNLLNKPGRHLSFHSMADTWWRIIISQPLKKRFLENVDKQGCLIPFCHSLAGEEFDEDVYQAIGQYEFICVTINIKYSHIGFPFAYYNCRFVFWA
jgi:hypothetical protein